MMLLMVAVGAMAHSKPYVASPVIQARLGFPDELVDGWEQRAVAKMGELLGKFCLYYPSPRAPPG